MNRNIKFYNIDTYTMKCRLYPNKTQAEQIDNILHGLRVLNNGIIYHMKNYHDFTTESPDKNNPGQFVHFPDFNKAFCAENIARLKEEYPSMRMLSGAMYNSKSYGLRKDMETAWASTKRYPVEKWGETYTDKETGDEITIGCKNYTDKRKRKSFSTKIRASRITPHENRNTLGIHIKLKGYEIEGDIKIRGWNQKIRFNKELTMDFVDYIATKGTNVIITISKDNCDDYWISFIFPKGIVWKPVNEAEEKDKCIGIDVGEITLATVSDGNKYDNLANYNKNVKKERNTISFLNRKLSRSDGWKNIKFREEAKEKRNKGIDVTTGKNYQYYEMKFKKLNRKIQRQRKDYYNNVTTLLSTQAEGIGIEGLRIKDMQISDKKDKKNGKRKPNKQEEEKA